jgi:predicted dehydrogenase
MEFLQPVPKQIFPSPPTVLIIGAGSRGSGYAAATLSTTNCAISAICEPIPYKRRQFGQEFIWGSNEPLPHQQFSDWREWVTYEEDRRARQCKGEDVEKGVDAVFVCVLDELHEEVVVGIAHLGVHVCCEKPLGTSLESCLKIYQALKQPGRKETVFEICHVLRYSPHNMLLRHLLLEEGVIGDVLSLEHVEPVGWWHFSHSYVRYVSNLISSRSSRRVRTNKVQRQLAQRIQNRPLPHDKILPRHRLHPLAPLLSASKRLHR